MIISSSYHFSFNISLSKETSPHPTTIHSPRLAKAPALQRNPYQSMATIDILLERNGCVFPMRREEGLRNTPFHTQTN